MSGHTQQNMEDFRTDFAADPGYGHNNLSDLLLSAAAALGVEGYPNILGLEAGHNICVILVDGLGHELVQNYRGHLPFIGKFAQRSINAAYPTTTACSLTTFGTGKPPGSHGVIGYDVYDPQRDHVNNMLSGWDPAVDPLQWQTQPTVFEKLKASAVEAVTVSQSRFEHSGLTQASLRGSSYCAADSLPSRVARTVEVLNQPGQQLVYFYIDEVDVAGHRHGVDSRQWREAVEDVDIWVKKFIQQLVASPAGPTTRVYLTADHGMVDVPAEGRIDLAEHRWLSERLRTTAGDPRFLQLFLRNPADQADIAAELVARFGDHSRIYTQAELREDGILGALTPTVEDRLGDLVLAAVDAVAYCDTARLGRHCLSMVGQHGSLTRVERLVPCYQLN